MPSRLKFQTETLPGSAAAYTGGVFSCAFLWRQPSRSGPGRSAIIAVSEHTTDLAERDFRALVDIEGAAETDMGVQQQPRRSEEHTSALQSIMCDAYAVLCMKQQKNKRD